MAFVARLLGAFHGHQTVAKVSDDERTRVKVTDERGSSGAGVEVGDDVPTGAWLTLLPRQHQYMHVIFGERYMLAISELQVHFLTCLTVGHKNSLQLGLSASNVFLMWSRWLCSSALSSLFHIYSSLIKSYPQAWGRSGVHRYATLLHIPPIPLLNCQNNFVFFSLIRPNLLLVCVFPACLRLCRQHPLRQLPWLTCET